MKPWKTLILIVTVALFTAARSSVAQSINQWYGNETGADWNDIYRWKLKHVPEGAEAVHFRQQNSLITMNSTIELGNGMHLYGQELQFEGNGNINLRSPIPHQRSIFIPASSSGYANLILTENLSLNGRIALAAKAFGTSAGKGSLTLKKRATVVGEVAIGNQGNGTGQIILRDQSSYRITGLTLDTRAEKGGSAEIHILGGTVRLTGGNKTFDDFLEDSSRRILIGDSGTLHIESNMPAEEKKRQLERMIAQKQILTTSGSKLGEPVIREDMLIVKSERFHISARSGEMVTASSPEPAHDEKPAEQTVKEPEAPSYPASGYLIFLTPLLLFALRPVHPSGPKSAAAKKGEPGSGKKHGLITRITNFRRAA